MLNLKVLGKYGPYPKPNCATSGYLLSSKTTNISIDMGSGIFSRLLFYIKPEKLDAIIISHFHYDHISDLFSLMYYLKIAKKKGELNKKIPLFVPFDVVKEYEIICKFDCFDVTTISSNQTIEVGDIVVTFSQMKHTVNSMGMKFVNENKSIVYSSDTLMCENLEKLVNGCDLFVCDGCVIEKNLHLKMPHMSVQEGCELAKKHGVKILITHINPHDDESEVLQEAMSTGANCEIIRELNDYLI